MINLIRAGWTAYVMTALAACVMPPKEDGSASDQTRSETVKGNLGKPSPKRSELKPSPWQPEAEVDPVPPPVEGDDPAR